MDDVRRVMERKILRTATERQKHCPQCARLLDYRDTVDVTLTLPGGNAASMTMCGADWDRHANRIKLEARRAGATLDIRDGRKLYG